MTSDPIDAHRIAPKLWVGSAPGAAHCAPFDVIVLCAVEYQPSLPCRTIHAPFDDTAHPSSEDLRTALDAAKAVNVQRARGRRVLVSCIQGRNRSALVAAIALMLAEGLSAQQAISAVRAQRKLPSGELVLANPAFVAFLKRATAS